MTTRPRIARAIAGLLSTSFLSGCATQVAALRQSAAVERGAPERCFGVARASRNDCKTNAHVCAGWAFRDADPQAFVYMPGGTCAKIVGGLPDPDAASDTFAP